MLPRLALLGRMFNSTKAILFVYSKAHIICSTSSSTSTTSNAIEASDVVLQVTRNAMHAARHQKCIICVPFWHKDNLETSVRSPRASWPYFLEKKRK